MDRFASMQTFVCVVETGSFSAAARRLNVKQPAISKSVAQLEERLGVRLLSRSTRGLLPTEAGQQFYERAKRSIEEADEADVAARGEGRGLAGRLRVSAAVTFARLHILPNLAIFLGQHPDLSIDIALDDRNIDLVENGIDVALRMGRLADSTMTARRLSQAKRIVVGTPGYFQFHNEPQSPAELGAHETIIYNNGPESEEWTFRRADVAVPVKVSGRVRISAAEGVRAIVLSGMGLTIASEWMFSDKLASGEVRQILKDWDLPTIDLWALYPTGRMISSKAKAFADFVEAIMREPSQAL